jgi:hypothetical protein
VGHADASFVERWRNGSARSRALRRGIHGVERLARGHEKAVALGTAEAGVAAHLGQPNPIDQLAVRRPCCDAAIAHVTLSAPCRAPQPGP